MTVVNAYDQLFAEGYLEAKTGAGTFVAARLPEEFLQTSNFERREHQESSLTRKVKFSAYGKNLAQNSESILRHHGKSSLVPFEHGVPGTEEFPFVVWAKIAQRWQKKPTSSILSYGDSVGFRPLREAIAAHLASARGVRCEVEQIIITNGTQQALDLIGRIFLTKTDDVYIEDPGYFGARDIFAATGARLVPVPVDAEGFDLQTARKRSRKARLAFMAEVQPMAPSSIRSA